MLRDADPRRNLAAGHNVLGPEEQGSPMAVLTLIAMMVARDETTRSDGDSAGAIAEASGPSHIREMGNRASRPRKSHPLLRQAFFLLGIVLIIVSPLVGAIPGPGGVVVFAAGLALVLKTSEWAKRQYVRFKRRHPNKGRWADWGMRRASARRREALHRAFAAGSVVEGGREQASPLPSSASPGGSPARTGEE